MCLRATHNSEQDPSDNAHGIRVIGGTRLDFTICLSCQTLCEVAKVETGMRRRSPLRPPQHGERFSRMTNELSAISSGSAATTRKHMRGDSLCTMSPTTAALATFPTACREPTAGVSNGSEMCYALRQSVHHKSHHSRAGHLSHSLQAKSCEPKEWSDVQVRGLDSNGACCLHSVLLLK